MPEIKLPSAEQIDTIIRLIGGGTEDIYGVEWDRETDTITRIEGAKNLVQSDFDKIFPWAGMRRCNLADNGTVNAYYGDPNYIEDGSNGQVMVEIPKFYYLAYRTTKGYVWLVSPNKKDGFKIHPAFVRNGREINYIYRSAFDGCIYDVSATAYLLNDEQVADFTVGTGDKLSSIAGVKPASGLTQDFTRANARILAQNRGTGWELQDFHTVSAIQLLMLIEYASFDVQSKIGKGVVDKVSGEGNESEITGATSSLGNSSGMAEGTNGLVSVSYRGIENFWGNIWKWVDGINIQDHRLYVSYHDFQDDFFDSPYEYKGNLAIENGYASNILFNDILDFGFIPTKTEGSSSTYLYDYYYQNTGNRVALLGGGCSNASYAGGFYWFLYYSSAYRSRIIGAALLYIPQE
jgi:hypothetical protein